MGRVRIVTDSTADIPASLASELEIVVVPVQIIWGQEIYQDGVDLASLTFFDRLAHTVEVPRTSQPPVSRFVETYRQLLEAGEGATVVSIHLAGNLSGTLNAAWAAAQTLPDPSRVEVIDSGQVSMGLGWAVIEAAKLARMGAGQVEIVGAVRALLPRLRTLAMIDTLDYLYRGGRISQVTAALGTALQIKPLIDIQSGHIEIVARARTRSGALKRLVTIVRDWGPLAQVMVLHTGAAKLAEDLADQLRGLACDGLIAVEPAGSALATHLGLGAVGVCALAAGDE
ncbi:MAG: DegV family protein [Anaerolineae bacterium]|jgi:DegV family protein with EDD domain